MKIVTELSARQLWKIGGDIAEPAGDAVKTDCGYVYENEQYRLTAVIEQGASGVCSRRDALKNLSDRPVTVNLISSRFRFDGGEYEAYAQTNGWVHESIGAWQPMNSGVQVKCESVRTSSGAAPFAALWNLQTGRGVAFHLLPDCAWQMTLTRVAAPSGRAYVEADMGVYGDFCVTLQPGESLDFPEILFYEIRSRIDLDAWKLHEYCNERWPRREMPVAFNSWLYLFSHLSVENVAACIPAAERIGCEYFVIDAGWFGKDPEWSRSIGDWVENENAGFCGRMKEVADKVRAHSMKFGLWFEIERALPTAEAVRLYPDYFLCFEGNCFLDFGNPEACEYMLDTLSAQIERYGIEYIKFDFNADLFYDKYRSAFTRYFAGYRAFMKELRRRHPGVYFQNCASGGMRMNLSNLADFDSYWFSDNQDPYEGMEIIKNTLLRLPPQVVDRWAVIQSVSGVRTYYSADKPMLLATASSTWESATGVQESWLQAFLTGGPMGFSCDLSKLDEGVMERLSAFVAEFKKNREFWKRASCRVLADTERLTVLQYSDAAFDEAVVVTYLKNIFQQGIQVFPVLDADTEYVLPDGRVMTGREIDEDGVWTDVAINQTEGNHQGRILTIRKKGL